DGGTAHAGAAGDLAARPDVAVHVKLAGDLDLGRLQPHLVGGFDQHLFGLDRDLVLGFDRALLAHDDHVLVGQFDVVFAVVGPDLDRLRAGRLALRRGRDAAHAVVVLALFVGAAELARFG